MALYQRNDFARGFGPWLLILAHVDTFLACVGPFCGATGSGSYLQQISVVCGGRDCRVDIHGTSAPFARVRCTGLPAHGAVPPATLET